MGRRKGVIKHTTKLQQRWRSGLWFMLAALALGFYLLARRLHTSGFDFSLFRASLAGADWRWLALAWLLCIASYYGRVLRWLVMLRPIAPAARRWDVFSATTIGFSAVVLFGRPGELVRPYLIARKAKVSVFSQLAAWLLERIYDTLAVLAIFGYGLVAVMHSNQNVGARMHWLLEKGGWFTAVSCTLCLAVLAGLQRYSDRLETRICTALGFLQAHHQAKAARIVGAVMDGLRSTRSFRSILLLFAYTALEWLVIFLCFVAVFRAFPATASLAPFAVLAYIGFVSFGSIVQIPGIGGGVQIASVLVLTEMFHIALEPATTVALASWLITLVGIVPLGVLLAFHEGLSWKRLRAMEEVAEL